MNIYYKAFFILFSISFLIKCDTKKKEASLLLNNETSIKKEANKILEKKVALYSSPSESSSILKKEFTIRDLDKDSILDVVMFLCLENKKDKAFKGTEIIFFKNIGKSLIFEDSQFYDKKHITPDVKANLLNKNLFLTNEVLADPYGKLNYSYTRPANITYFNSLYYDYTSNDSNFDNYYSSTSDLTKDVRYTTYRQKGQTKYVTAKNGLLCRNAPGSNGDIIYKFDYKAEVNVIGITNQKATFFDKDRDKHIEEYWFLVTISDEDYGYEIEEGEEGYSDEPITGFVFGGYLED